MHRVLKGPELQKYKKDDLMPIALKLTNTDSIGTRLVIIHRMTQCVGGFVICLRTCYRVLRIANLTNFYRFPNFFFVLFTSDTNFSSLHILQMLLFIYNSRFSHERIPLSPPLLLFCTPALV